MVEVVTLGEITCPSGELVLLDGGHLGVWSGDGAPEEIDDPQIPPSADLEVVGPDAARSATATFPYTWMSMGAAPRWRSG